MEICSMSALSSPDVAFKCTTSAISVATQFLVAHAMSMAVPTVLLLATIKLWWKYMDGGKDPNCDLPLPPGSMGLPLVGETLNFLMKGSEFFRERTKSYGRVYKTHLLGQKTIRVTGAENVSKILKGEGEIVQSQWPPSTKLILGDGALAHSKGDTHSWRRQMIMRAFSPVALRTYVPTVQGIVKDYVKQWCQQGEIHGYAEARNLTFTVAAKMLLGFDIKEKQKHQMLILFEDMLATLFSMPIPIPGIGLYRGLKARKRIMQEIAKCIKDRQDHDESDQHEDALALILEASEDGSRRLSTTEVQDSALEMLFAGHLPTSSAATSVLMMLGHHSKVYDKLSVELHDNGLLTGDAPLDYDIITKLPYLDAVIKEVLRVAPPVGAGYRKALQTFEVDGCQVPKGWTVIYSIRETHHTSENNGGEEFNPDRWMSPQHNLVNFTTQSTADSQVSKQDFDYVPFGYGSRACVGQKYVEVFLKVFAIELVRNASWRLPNGMPKLMYMPVPYPKDNLPLQMKEMPADLRRRAFTLSW